MKNAFLILSLVLTSVFAQADLGSAEIYLMKSDSSFDFISLDSNRRPVVNQVAASSANIQTILQLDSKYHEACFDGALVPLQDLLFGMARNEGQIGETVEIHPLRALGKGLVELTFKVADKVPVTVQIRRCDL